MLLGMAVHGGCGGGDEAGTKRALAAAAPAAAEAPASFNLYGVTSRGVGSYQATLVSVAPASGAQAILGGVGAATGATSAIDHDASTGALYGVDGAGTPGGLQRIDPVTGASTTVGTVHDAAGRTVMMVALTFAADGTLYVGTPDSIGRVDRKTYVFTELFVLPAVQYLAGIDISSTGVLYAVYHNRSNDRQTLVSIDPRSMTVTREVGITGNFNVGDIDAAPDGVIYHTNFSYALERIDPSTGVQSSVGAGTIGALSGIASSTGLDPGALFDWAEKAYSEYFPSHQTNQISPPYIYRYYPETGNYVGVEGTTVLVLGPISNGALQEVGKISDFECLVYPARCSAPVVTQQPADQAVAAPDAASFKVTASGTPLPVYQWQISTDGVTFSNIDGATSSTFTLSPTTLADKGKRYRVVVTNRAGSVTSTAATLDVYPAIASYAFAALGSRMTTARAMHTATTLQDGKVLITGGFSANTSPGAALNTAELYDPATKTFTALTARMRSARTSHAAALLPDGRVLITGGQADNNNGDGVATAELYDPSTRTFSSVVALMKSPRGGHSSTLLANGKVLLAGGYYGPRPLTSDAELFDPATQTFTALAAKMVTVTEGHRATLLPSGRVLVSGGSDNNLFRSVQEQFDPVTQAFSALGARMTTVRGAHEATMLPGRWVVLTGGASSFSPSGVTAHRSAEVFDTVTQVFSSIAAMMTTARAGHAAARLADGSVLLTGGATTTVPGGGIAVLDTAELFRVGASIDKPSVSISADPSSLVLGNSATLRWTATLADSCVASGAWSGAKGLSGTQAVTPAATGLQTYTLACAGPGGTTTASATVQVQAPAAIPTVSLSANPTTVAAGSTFTLQWSSANATSCTASGSWAGAKSTAGSETVQAGTTAGSRTFTLTCTGPGGSASSTTTVNVTDIACAQIGGTWTETGRMTGTCEPQDDFDSGTQTGTGTIVQNGCNISISIAGVTRAGTVRGFSFTLTGPVGISTPGLTLTANTITITGSISADARRITATGVGQVGGVFDDGFAQMCTVNTTSTMTR